MAWQLVGLIGVGLAYLLGSTPTGYLLGRWLKGIDLREIGSGSTGATNVLRNVGKGPAIAVLLIDALKGAAAVLICSQWLYGLAVEVPSVLTPAWWGCIGGLVALLGHSKSIWLGFKGGKSVAAGLGVLFALNWQIALGTLAAFGVVVLLVRMVSAGSMAAAIAVNILMWIFVQPLPFKAFALLGGAYVIWRHQTNIQRILAGTEPRLGQKVGT
ncbi:MAG: glycerol-3-phosphate 1-O-acyltransferase PlsY [Cyanobacteria bacterium P01_H01_bin.121]